jgi:soluble lytic murein transglycosylase-like protein
MRTRTLLAVLASTLSACAPMRGAAPQAPPAGSHAARRALEPSPVPPAPARAPHLGCLQHPRIDVWEHRLRSQPRHRVATERSLERGASYLPLLREIMSETGLPPSLALLPAVESSFRPRARGRFGDLGLWQLRPATARRFGLVVNKGRDDRLNPERSTRAAARYLKILHRRYRGDWPLVLAAYNAGEARVDRALARRPDADFWELAEAGQLPRTSRDFVPRFLALVRVSEDAAACQATLPTQQARGGSDG